MAKIGLDNLKYAVVSKDEASGVEYKEAGKPFAKVVDCKVSIDTEEAKLYADNMVAESDFGFKSGTMTLTIDEADDTTFAEILGHTIGEPGTVPASGNGEGEMVRNAKDSAPYVGVGRILEKMVNGVRKYKVEFIAKVKFKEAAQEEKTRGESLEFDTSSVEGGIFVPADGNWSRTQTFSDKEKAIEYLNSLFKTAAA